MSTESPQVTAARIEVERARGRLIETAHELQDRLSPRTLARNTWEGAKVKGADLAENAVDQVKKRPVTAGGIAAAVTLLLARDPILGLAGRLFGSSAKKRKSRARQTGRTANSKTETIDDRD